LVVEHDEETIKHADYVVDLGPGAGELGGHVVAVGTPDEIRANPSSLTGRYLAGALEIPVPATRRKGSGHVITIHNPREHNLKGMPVRIPLGTFTSVTGVSGSGKSTLVNDILYRALAQMLHRAQDRPGAHDRIEGAQRVDKVAHIHQSPLGRTPRSNPATYTGVFTFIRTLFARTPEARMRGYAPGRFSFNVKGGRCEACQGDGLVKIEMHFLPDVYVTCDVCKGRRYNRETLDVRYKGRSIAEILDMTVREALGFFDAVPVIRTKLQTLDDVGLDYIRLGQSATTLSGGEAQRVKLATELSRRATGRTLYILDEPTTGLHFADIQRLLDVLTKLVDQGNTVVIIEHNLDVVKTADWGRRIREGEARWGRPIAILQDLQGPKIRLGTFGPGGGARVDLEPGRPFTLSARPVEGTAELASITHPEYLRDLRAGDEIWMDDGMIQLRVESTSADEVRCRVVVGGRISDHKGLSLPRVTFPVSCLTPKDREDLSFGLRQGVDYVAVSFVRS